MRPFARALALLACALALPAAALPPDDAVRALLAQRLARGQGVAFAVVLHDASGTRIVTAGPRSHGGPPVDADTVFEIGSITKTFTGLLLADAVVRGERRLDAPVAPQLPFPAPALARAATPVTYLALATHTAGLPRLPPDFAPADAADPYADYDAAKLARSLSGDWTLAPGGRYAYSNFGAGLLGYALAGDGRAYDARVQARIAGPLGLRATGLAPSGAAATGHDAALRPAGAWHLDALAGAGALRSTPADMGRYLQAALRAAGTPSAEAWRLATTPVVRGPGPATRVALGWHVLERAGRPITWHNGMTGGHASMIAFDAQRGEGVVVLGNAAIGVDDLAFHLLDPAFPLAAPRPARTAIALDAAEVERIVGRYEVAEGLVLDVRRAGAGLVVQMTGQPALPLHAAAPLSYFLRDVDAVLVFQPDAGGRIGGVVLTQNGRDSTARRLPPEAREAKP